MLARVAPILTILAGLCAVPPCAAQPDDESTKSISPWTQWVVVQVEPTMVDEFLAVQRELSARAREAKVPRRLVSRTEIFGDTYRFFISTPFESFAGFDKRQERDPAIASLIQRAERCVTARRVYAVRSLPAATKPLPAEKQPDLMVVNLVQVAPGREQDYLDVLTSDFLPHFDEAEMHYTSGSLAFGGEGGFLHLFHVPSFAELDKGSPVLRALGAEGARAASAKLAGIVTSSEQWIARVVPEASYGPDPEPNQAESAASGAAVGPQTVRKPLKNSRFVASPATLSFAAVFREPSLSSRHSYPGLNP